MWNSLNKTDFWNIDLEHPSKHTATPQQALDQMHECKCVFVFFTAIREFPDDVFTNAERKSGAVLLHIIAVRKSVWLSLSSEHQLTSHFILFLSFVKE